MKYEVSVHREIIHELSEQSLRPVFTVVSLFSTCNRDLKQFTQCSLLPQVVGATYPRVTSMIGAPKSPELSFMCASEYPKSPFRSATQPGGWIGFKLLLCDHGPESSIFAHSLVVLLFRKSVRKAAAQSMRPRT